MTNDNDFYTKDDKQMLNRLLGNVDFRSLIYRIMQISGAESSESGYADDARREAYNLGRKSIGLEIRDMILTCEPDEYLHMRKEYQDKINKLNKEDR